MRLRLGSFCLTVIVGFQVGCDSKGGVPLVIATTWSSSELDPIKAILATTGDTKSIEWVSLENGESLAKTIDRRGGVDLVLGVPCWEFGRLASLGRLQPLDPADRVPWQTIHRSNSSRQPAAGLPRDPRDDPDFLARARSILQSQGWPKGYELLVRNMASFSDVKEPADPATTAPEEALALIKGGRNLVRARQLIQGLQERGIVNRPTADAKVEAMADALLADLLGAALVDSSAELRDAAIAIVRYHHPARAEASIGERPPWPPASVLKLREAPNGEALVDTLLEQVAPDPQARAWLKASWTQPRRPIDGPLLLEIARADEGRLVNEPRFRAWLRGEWTAWSRQLYRRVARLAGGYVPS